MMAKLGAFCTGAGLPAASIVVAGAPGWHAYWVFNRPVRADKWRPVEDALAITAVMSGLPADCPRTMAQQLDVPETVAVIHPVDGATPVRYSPDELLAILEEFVSNAVLFPKRARATA
jgi:hypothetical protein